MDKGRKLELLNKFNFSRQQRELLSTLLSAVDEKEIIKELAREVENVFQEKLVAGDNIKNINGESILGEGNISVASKIPIINHGTSDTTYALTPNVYHIWGAVDNLDFTLVTPEDNTIVNEYWFRFESGNVPTAIIISPFVNFPVYSDLIPEPNMIYEVHIIGNYAVWNAWEVANL